MAFNEDSSASGHDEPWIQWFCGLKGHEMFCEVERSYIEDGFNLYGLRACVSNFSDCLDLILDRIGPDDDSDDSHLTQSACTLYGLIHARYIITAHGLDAMYSKYAAKEFGTCPLVQCNGQPVLPVSLKDEMGADTVKIYCPKCSQVYHPPPSRSRTGSSSGVDGAAFGTTFPHLFLMTFSNLVPDPLPVDSAYIPRVFGFRVHKSARQRVAAAVAAAAAAPPPAAVAASATIVVAPPCNPAVEADKCVAGEKKNDEDESNKSPPSLEANNHNAVGQSSTGVGLIPGNLPEEEKRSSRKRRNNNNNNNNNKQDAAEVVAAPSPPAPAGVANNKPKEANGGNTGAAVPSFMVENPVNKRRRRNNNST